MTTKTKSQSTRSRSRWPSGWLALAALGAIGVVAFVFFNSQQAARAQPEIPAGYDLSSWSENGQGGKYLLQVVDGQPPLPGVQVSGVVTSDTNCEPDAQGVNHCGNGIRLANGNTINVIDNHMMMRNPCLSPGETLLVTRYNDSWVVAVASQGGMAP